REPQQRQRIERMRVGKLERDAERFRLPDDEAIREHALHRDLGRPILRETAKRSSSRRFAALSAGPFWPIASRIAANTTGCGRIVAAWACSRSHCKYEKGDTKSKYQSTIIASGVALGSP